MSYIYIIILQKTLLEILSLKIRDSIKHVFSLLMIEIHYSFYLMKNILTENIFSIHKKTLHTIKFSGISLLISLLLVLSVFFSSNYHLSA